MNMQKEAQAQQFNVIAQQRHQAEETARSNITAMLRVVKQDQVSLTEAAIRIMSFRQALPIEQQDQTFFKPFEALALATAHIPILDNWKALAPLQQTSFNDERTVLEQGHQADIQAAAEAYLSSQG